MLTDPSTLASTIEGVVKDDSGRPLENARIDHTGQRVVNTPPNLAIKSPPSESRTDSEGHFRVVTEVPAIVIRKPGYVSQRIRVDRDASLVITLQPIQSTSRCKLSAQPAFKTKNGDDIDYTATWFYIETDEGPQGIISGSGPVYSFGAPSDRHVWTSVEYTELMYESGVIDASGRSPDGKYWRERSIFGAEAQYYNQTREIAEQLDCVMDRIPIKMR